MTEPKYFIHVTCSFQKGQSNLKHVYSNVWVALLNPTPKSHMPRFSPTVSCNFFFINSHFLHRMKTSLVSSFEASRILQRVIVYQERSIRLSGTLRKSCWWKGHTHVCTRPHTPQPTHTHLHPHTDLTQTKQQTQRSDLPRWASMLELFPLFSI